MEEMLVQFKKEWESACRPLSFSMIYCYNDLLGFEVFSSNLPEYVEGNLYPIYDIVPLMRLLLMKEQALGPNLEEQLYEQQGNSTICKVLSWLPQQKRVILFKLDKLDHFDENLFADLLQKDQLTTQFDQLYLLSRENL